jgi:hypothetical protein
MATPLTATVRLAIDPRTDKSPTTTAAPRPPCLDEGRGDDREERIALVAP